MKPKPAWGEPTWTFLHVLAERVDPAQYAHFREELLHVVRSVGANLPCPECAGHASAFLARADARFLPTKQHFRHFLCDFHNSVNARLNYPPFDPLALADRYAAGEFAPAAARFLRTFEAGGAPLHGGSFQRTQVARFLRSWCDSHRFLFLFAAAAAAPLGI